MTKRDFMVMTPKQNNIGRNVESMFSVFFNFEGGMFYKYAPRGQTTNKVVLKRLRDVVGRK